jgi:hypothetical protein
MIMTSEREAYIYVRGACAGRMPLLWISFSCRWRDRLLMSRSSRAFRGRRVIEQKWERAAGDLQEIDYRLQAHRTALVI